jgi:hypothetical protein
MKTVCQCRVPVVHIYNPSYSGGRYQENGGLRPAWAKGFPDLISKKKKTPHHDKGLVEWLKV